MNNISWRGIRAFISVVEHGSFTAAADTSGFSKANLSQLVSELEASLSVQLLYRTTRKLRLTEVGEGYYQQCKQALLQLDAAAEWASQSVDELKGRIRMNSVGGPIGENLLAPIIIQFQQQYPDIDVNLDFSSVHVDLIEKHYDLVVRMGKLPDSTLIARKLQTIMTRYVASPEFIARHSRITRPEDLENLPLIYGSVDHWVMRRGSEQRIIHPKKGMKVVSGRVMRRATFAGLGVTRLADVYCQADIDNGTLVEVLPKWSEEPPLSLVCPPIRHQMGRVRTLLTWVSDHFGPRYQQALRFGPALDI